LRGLSTKECNDYDKVKRSILSYFKLDANAYLTAFTKERRTGNETYKMWANRFRDLQTGYFSESGIDTLEKLSDSMLAEQVCNGLPELAKKYVCDKQAKTADECATQADRWFLGTYRLCDSRPGAKLNQSSRNFYTRANGGNKISPTESGARGLGACWTCNSHTHLSNACLENAFKSRLCTSCGKHHAPNVRCNDESASGVYSSFVGNVEIDKQYVFPLCVNSRESTALRDTGNFGPVIVKTALNPNGAFSQESMSTVRDSLMGVASGINCQSPESKYGAHILTLMMRWKLRLLCVEMRVYQAALIAASVILYLDSTRN